MGLRFSECREGYLLYLILEGANSFKWIDNDVVDGVVHSLYLDVDEELFESFLWFAHSDY